MARQLPRAVLTLAAVHTLGVPVDLPTALLLSVEWPRAMLARRLRRGRRFIAADPLACNMFGIERYRDAGSSGRLYYRRVQDSCETALNSSTDVLFTARQPAGRGRTSGEPTPCVAK